jgi:uncharacterized iron-regulated protein
MLMESLSGQKSLTSRVSAAVLSLRFYALVLFLLAAGGCSLLSFGKATPAKASFDLDEGWFLEVETGRILNSEAFLDKLARTDVVFLGEIHHNPRHEAFHVALVEALWQRSSRLALGLEYFSRNEQGLLDDWSRGVLDKKTFLSKLERKPSALPYGELLQLAQDLNIQLYGINLPRRVVSQVAKKGWENLPLAEQVRWPEPGETSEAYRNLVQDSYSTFQRHHSTSFEGFLRAQMLWDATMAQSILRLLQNQKGRPLVVVVGMKHVEYGLGIPARLKALSHASLTVVLPSDALEGPTPALDRPVADYLWFDDPKTLASLRGS